MPDPVVSARLRLGGRSLRRLASFAPPTPGAAGWSHPRLGPGFRLRIGFALALGLGLALSPAPLRAAEPPSGSPMAELKKSNAQLDKVLQKNKPNWSPEAELERAEVKKLVGSFLDYEELARRSLAKSWEKLTPKQREEFVETLRQLVERSYLKQVHGSPNYNIKYETEQITGSEADVTATLSTTSHGKKTKVSLEYKTLWKGGRWVVYDVVTDEQSMLENYRAEFNKIINRDGFEALLKKMKKKLDEKDDDGD